MFAHSSSRRRSTGLSRRAAGRARQAGVRRLTLESLEDRHYLSAAPLTFQVVDDASTNRSFRYSEVGAAQGSTTLATANAAPRGVASTVALDKTWVIDANRNVYVYNSTTGGLLGSWSAGSMANNATPEGIATDGTDIWIVDSRSDKVFRYAGAASRLNGTQPAASSFNLSNSNPKDMVTDGYSLWVVDDAAKSDKVFKYNLAGGWVDGSWTIDAANKAPTGIALDPVNVGDLWIADSGTDRVYKYAAAVSRTSGSQAAAVNFALASGNANPQGLVVPGRPWSETPYQMEWIRQFGTAGNDEVRGLTVDSSGVVYLSGGTTGALAASNPDGLPTPYIARYDAAGNQTWIQQDAPIAGPAEYGGIRVATDGQGNVFQVINLWEGYSSTLRSYDPTGALRWEAVAPVGERLFDVTVDAQGFAYTASHEDGNENVHIRKFNGDTGGVAWEVVLQALGTTGISADEMGNVYVSAHTSGALLGSTAGAVDALVIKVSESGNVLWTRQYGSAGFDYSFYVAADPIGNVYSAGRTDGSLGGPNSGQLDVFLAKHDAAGNELWKQQWGTSAVDTRADMWVDPQGNVYRAIETNGALGGAPIGGKDIVVAKFDPQGVLIWATQLGTSGDDDAAGGIWGDDAGNLYVGGGTTGSWGSPNAGSRDAYVIKLAPPPAAATAQTSHKPLAALTALAPQSVTVEGGARKSASRLPGATPTLDAALAALPAVRTFASARRAAFSAHRSSAAARADLSLALSATLDAALAGLL
jgi:hypothetical protein